MADWTLNVASRELTIDGVRKRLSEKPFQVLHALVEANGEVVSREHLQKLLWSHDTFVDFDNNLNSAVATLRQALGDSARTPTFIETIPKVGYRLLAKPTPLPVPDAVRSHGWKVRYAYPFLGTAVFVILWAAFAFGDRKLSRSEPTTGSASANQEARNLFERGMYLRGQYEAMHESTEFLTSALEAFVQAGRLDPAFVAARAEEAETLVDMSFGGLLPFGDGLSRARDAATGALTLSPDNATAARVMGVTTLFLDWNAEASRVWLDRAQASRNDGKTALAMAMWWAAQGRFNEAVDAAERAVSLDPKTYYVRADLAMFYLGAGRDRDAAQASHDVLKVAPDFVPAMAYAVMAHERLGEWDQAAAQVAALMHASGASPQDLTRVTRAQGQDAVALWRQWDLDRIERQAVGRRADFALELARRHAALGNRGAAISELEQALAAHNALLAFLRSYPELTVLHGDPRFEAIADAVSGQG